MNLHQFLDHWKIVENPFRGEEARQDPVFLRLEAASQAGSAGVARAAELPCAAPAPGVTAHSDFEKIAGDFARPSTAIVFGEKGSGKTAIRLQLADRVAAYNRASPAARCLWIGYDDLNPVLSRFMERARTERKATVNDTLGKMRLTDHLDALLSLAVPAVVDALLKERSPTQTAAPPVQIDLPDEPRKLARKMEPAVRRDLLALQVVYDRPDAASGAERRTRRLRSLLRVVPPLRPLVWAALAYLGWVPAAAYAAYVYLWLHQTPDIDPTSVISNVRNPVWVVAGLLLAYLVVLLKHGVVDRLRWMTFGHRLRKQVRVSVRSDASFGRSLRAVPGSVADPSALPVGPSDEPRYAMLERLRRVLAALGYAGMLLVVDRVDEPTLVSGDPERMKAVVWPMLNNKFLSQPFLGVKMLLPMELRHALFRESAAFFQEARLDKQNLIERLSWTGSMLYDLCDARLRACRAPGAEPLSLLDLFAEDVTRADLIDALDQMHQPRDAFKMLYQCLVDHCASVTSDQAQWRVPRLILESVKRSQVERVKQLSRGIRPA
jgi:hypothetical protein